MRLLTKNLGSLVVVLMKRHRRFHHKSGLMRRRWALIPSLRATFLTAAIVLFVQLPRYTRNGAVLDPTTTDDNATTPTVMSPTDNDNADVDVASVPEVVKSRAHGWLQGLHVPRKFIISVVRRNESTKLTWLRHTPPFIDTRRAAEAFLLSPSRWLCYVGLLHARIHLHQFHKRQWRNSFRGAYSTCHESHHARFSNWTLHKQVWDACNWRSNRQHHPPTRGRTRRAAPNTAALQVVEVNLREGLGNQLFQLAFAETLVAAAPPPLDAKLRIVGAPDAALNSTVLFPFMYRPSPARGMAADKQVDDDKTSRCVAPEGPLSEIDELLLTFSSASASAVSGGIGGVVISDKPSYAVSASKTGFPPFVYQLLLLSAVISPSSTMTRIRCITLDGYFQEMGYYYYQTFQENTDNLLPSPPELAARAAPPLLLPIRGSSAVVVHVRRCEKARSFVGKKWYPALPKSYYHAAMRATRNFSDASSSTAPLAIVVTPPQCRKSGIVQSLLAMKNTSVELADDAWSTAADHFSILRSAAALKIPLVLSVGTFSWWACWLGVTLRFPSLTAASGPRNTNAAVPSVGIPLAGCQMRHMPLVHNGAVRSMTHASETPRASSTSKQQLGDEQSEEHRFLYYRVRSSYNMIDKSTPDDEKIRWVWGGE